MLKVCEILFSIVVELLEHKWLRNNLKKKGKTEWLKNDLSKKKN